MIAALRGALEPAAALLLADADAALTRTSSAGAVETALDYARLRMRQDEQSPDDVREARRGHARSALARALARSLPPLSPLALALALTHTALSRAAQREGLRFARDARGAPRARQRPRGQGGGGRAEGLRVRVVGAAARGVRLSA